MLLVAGILFLPVLGLAFLTGVGARTRGAEMPLALVEGLVFPVTWTVWYVRDRR